jgi:hypothetical protein
MIAPPRLSGFFTYYYEIEKRKGGEGERAGDLIKAGRVDNGFFASLKRVN